MLRLISSSEMCWNICLFSLMCRIETGFYFADSVRISIHIPFISYFKLNNNKYLNRYCIHLTTSRDYNNNQTDYRQYCAELCLTVIPSGNFNIFDKKGRLKAGF